MSPRRPSGLVVDSGAVLDPTASAEGTIVVPLRIVFDGEVLRDGLDIGPETFYARLGTGELPTTSTPSPGEYLEAFRAADADEIVCLTIVRTLSAMHESASLAARLFAESGDERRVHVVDTGSAAAGFGLIARAASELVSRGSPAAEVLARVASGRAEVRMFGTLRTLAYLARSGRVPHIAAGVGDLLGVRPVFELRSGSTRRLALVRGDRRVLRAMARIADDHWRDRGPIWLLVFHSGAEAEAAALRESIHAVVDVGRSETAALSPVVGAYTGPGMIGFAAMPLQPGEMEAIP